MVSSQIKKKRSRSQWKQQILVWMLKARILKLQQTYGPRHRL